MSQLRSNSGSRGSHTTGRTARGWIRVPVILALAAGAGGCYSYQPADGPTPPPTETVRIQLSGAGQDALRQRRGIQLQRFEGRILEENGDELTVQARLPANLMAFGPEQGTVLDTLEVLRPHVRTMDVKQFSTGRTVLGAAGGVAAIAGIYAVVEAVVSSTEDGGETGPGGGVVISVIPWVTGVLGWLR